MPGEVVGVLLAAGFARRFGGDKLLHPLADGTPMAAAAARMLRSACRCCVAVLRPEQRRLAVLLASEGIDVRFEGEASLGLGHSLAAAVRLTPMAGGWLVALADMPFIAPATAAKVTVALYDGADLAAPFFRGSRGHPIGFSSRWREALSRLQGDEGARHLLTENADAVTRIDCDDPGILIDIDTPDRLALDPRAIAAGLPVESHVC